MTWDSGWAQQAALTCPHGGLRNYCPYCTFTQPAASADTPHVPMGWQCACKRVYSPDVLQCPHCGPRTAVPAENFTGGSDCAPPSEGGLCDHDGEPARCTGGRHCSC